MTSDNTFYSEFVRDLFVTDPTSDRHATTYLSNFGLLHAAVGLAGEAAEVLENVKKTVFTQKPYNIDAILKELGDVEFYLQALRNELRVSRDHILKINVEKLTDRHMDRRITDYYQETTSE